MAALAPGPPTWLMFDDGLPPPLPPAPPPITDASISVQPPGTVNVCVAV